MSPPFFTIFFHSRMPRVSQGSFPLFISGSYVFRIAMHWGTTPTGRVHNMLALHKESTAKKLTLVT